MYNFITTKKLNELIQQQPIINEHPSLSLIDDLRKMLGCGIYQAKLLMQRSNTIQEAINLNHNIIMEINKSN